MKIIIDSNIPFIKGVLEHVAKVQYYSWQEINREKVKDADALIIRTRTKCNKELLDNSAVKFIATNSIGYDHIDIKYCEKRGINWVNAPGCNSSSVNQYIACSLLHLANKYNFSLKDKTLGVIGVGNIGKKVVATAEILGMQVLLNDPPRERKEGGCGFISLDGIVRDCDIITFHVPLNMEGTDKTFHLCDDTLISKMNKGTVIISSSRGEVVETNAMKNAVKNNYLMAVVNDVFENEPDADKGLISLSDIATPHIAGYSLDGKVNATRMAVQALSRFFNLGMDNWMPGELPVPENNVIEILEKGLTDQDIFYKAITSTYDIFSDDKKLRYAPDEFENHRKTYPLRREFPAYKIRLNKTYSDMHGKLQKLGFKLI